MNAANYITTTEFATMNPELDLSAYSDTTISGMINRASVNMDNYLQYSLGIEDIVGEKNEAVISSNGNLVIFTKKMPVVSVSAIQLKLGTVHLDLNLTDGNGNDRYEVGARSSYVMYPYQEISLTGTFSIRNFFQLRDREIFTVMNYRAGYDTIPADLKDACNLWAKDIFIRQANPQDVSSVTQGAISMSFRSRDAESGDSTWVKQAKSILNRYKRVTS